MPYCDGPDEEWIEDEGADDPNAEVMACPSCRRGVHEDTQQCPHCGEWITPVYPQGAAMRWMWLVVIAMMILSMVIVAVL